MTFMRPLLLPLVLLIAIGAGCGPIDEIKKGFASAPSPSSTSTATASTTSDETTSLHDQITSKIKITISIWSNRYSPKDISVSQGVTITFKNNDTENHSVTSNTGKFDLGVLLPGQSKKLNTKEFSFGTYGYHDQLNPEIKGSFTVR
jgi:plastocyanin